MNYDMKPIVKVMDDAITKLNKLMEEPNFRKILKEKRYYYGLTEAAIEFAAEEFAKEYHETQKEIEEHGTVNWQE